MRYCLALALLCSCASGSGRTPTTAEVNQVHEHACTAKALVVVAEGLSFNEPCTETAPKVRKLFVTDEDCLAYMGDAAPSVSELCSLVMPNDKKDAGHD